MLYQFKNGPSSVIDANAAAGAYLAGEPAYANNTNSLYIGGVLLSTGATYFIQGTQPPNPANPDTAKAFWFDTDDNFLYIWKYAGGVGSWARVLASGETGPAGAQGVQGATGLTGAQGIQGVRGATFLSGTTGPLSTTTAIDGDYFLNTTTRNLYGPRVTVNGVVSWGGAIDLKGETGAQGIQGVTGLTGADGPAGSKIFYGNEVPTSTFPSSTERREGDFYIDLVAGRLYGGYSTSQGWGAGVSLLGPSGPAGAKGDTGPAGIAGLEWKGAWKSGTTYPMHSVVEQGGSSYVSIKNTTNAPTVISDWELVAAKGTGGSAGLSDFIAESPLVWNSGTSTITFSVPDAVAGNVLKYNGTAWVADTSTAAKSINSGPGAPNAETGLEGDFYMQLAGTGSPILFGPKTGTSWGTGVSLIGAAGANGQNGIAGPPGANGTAGMEWNGEWDPTVNYSIGAVVSYQGQIYICEIADSLNITPNTTANWDLLVAKGEQGDPASLVGTSPVNITSENSNGLVTFTVALTDGTETGDVITWNNANKTWSAQAPNMLLSGLNDVTITTPAAGEVLTYNGTKWNNGEITINSLSDVIINTPAQGQILSFNGTNWENAETITAINATSPLNWDATTSTVSISNGTEDLQSLLWDKTTMSWQIKDLPAANLTANSPLYWSPTDKVLSFGVGAQAGNVLMYDGVAWVADTPYDHSRPTILWGDGVPDQGLGRSGDFYIDTTGHYLYGPKCAGCLNNKWTSIQNPLNLVGPQGPQGLQGPQGVQGVQGVIGLTGAQGNSTQNLIRQVNHVGDPSTMPPYTNYNYIGNNGDFLLVNSSYSVRWYGPKAAGAWPTNTYVELKGTEGIQGVQGIQGIPGPQSGQIIHHATVSSNLSIPPDPNSSLGEIGDFHITELNTTTGEYIGSYLFGPKTSSATDPWGTPVNLRGPTGPAGATGPQGIAGITPNPALSDIDGGLFNTGTPQDPTLAIKTTTGTGLLLKNIGVSTHPHLSLDLDALGVFYVDSLNRLRLRPVSNNASQRRSFFGI